MFDFEVCIFLYFYVILFEKEVVMRIFRIFMLIMLCSIFIGCSNANPYSKSGFYFDTVITITLFDNSNDELIDECFRICEELENKFSISIETSEISRINAANGAPVKVSNETLELLHTGIYYGQLSNGCFDITIAPLSTLWNFDKQSQKIPSDVDIETALTHVNYKNIKIDGNTVTLTDTNASINLGGIAKGYIADRLKQYLLENNVSSAIINLGGNVVTIGQKEDGSPFKIGIQKPFSQSGETMISLSSTDNSIVTSGVYERCFTVEDTLYHHILDITTGYPCETDLLSATILSDNSVDGDALSTICILLGSQKSIELIEDLENIDAIFITKDYEIIDTRN